MTDDMTVDVREIVGRCRRIETRLTKYLESQGFETQVRRPFWNGKSVVIPTLTCAVSDMLEAIPLDHRDDDEITVIYQGQTVMHLYLPTP